MFRRVSVARQVPCIALRSRRRCPARGNVTNILPSASVATTVSSQLFQQMRWQSSAGGEEPPGEVEGEDFLPDGEDESPDSPVDVDDHALKVKRSEEDEQLQDLAAEDDVLVVESDALVGEDLEGAQIPDPSVGGEHHGKIITTNASTSLPNFAIKDYRPDDHTKGKQVRFAFRTRDSVLVVAVEPQREVVGSAVNAERWNPQLTSVAQFSQYEMAKLLTVIEGKEEEVKICRDGADLTFFAAEVPSEEEGEDVTDGFALKGTVKRLMLDNHGKPTGETRTLDWDITFSGYILTRFYRFVDTAVVKGFNFDWDPAQGPVWNPPPLHTRGTFEPKGATVEGMYGFRWLSPDWLGPAKLFKHPQFDMVDLGQDGGQFVSFQFKRYTLYPLTITVMPQNNDLTPDADTGTVSAPFDVQRTTQVSIGMYNIAGMLSVIEGKQEEFFIETGKADLKFSEMEDGDGALLSGYVGATGRHTETSWNVEFKGPRLTQLYRFLDRALLESFNFDEEETDAVELGVPRPKDQVLQAPIDPANPTPGELTFEQTVALGKELRAMRKKITQLSRMGASTEGTIVRHSHENLSLLGRFPRAPAAKEALSVGSFSDVPHLNIYAVNRDEPEAGKHIQIAYLPSQRRIKIVVTPQEGHIKKMTEVEADDLPFDGTTVHQFDKTRQTFINVTQRDMSQMLACIEGKMDSMHTIVDGRADVTFGEHEDGFLLKGTVVKLDSNETVDWNLYFQGAYLTQFYRFLDISLIETFRFRDL